MPECHQRSAVVRPGAPLTIGSVTLLPIERVVLHAHGNRALRWISVAKEPYALIVRDASGVRALDGNAMAVTLDALRKTVPGLDIALAAM